MGDFNRVLERVVEATEWFMRNPALELLYVETTDAMRIPVLQHLCATEMLDFHGCPFFVLEAPTEVGNDGWDDRCEELRADWQDLAEQAEQSPGAIWASSTASRAIARFAAELHSALQHLPAPATGLVVVFAPVWIRDPEQWQSDLRAIMRDGAWRNARFVVVESDSSHTRPIADELGSKVESVNAKPDLDELGREGDARLELMKSAPVGASSAQLVGGAGPDVAPPIRINAAPQPSEEQLREHAEKAGVSPVVLDAKAMQELRVDLLAAASAMRNRDTATAVQHQRAAFEFCDRNGLPREAIINELILGGFSLQGGGRNSALAIFRDAFQRATAQNLFELAIQAKLAEASTLLVLDRKDEAVGAYTAAGDLAEQHALPVLGIEAFRVCGQLLVSWGLPGPAARAFQRALDLGDQSDPDTQRDSSLPEAARNLAALCRRHGLLQQAESLEAQAAAIESSTPEMPQQQSLESAATPSPDSSPSAPESGAPLSGAPDPTTPAPLPQTRTFNRIDLQQLISPKPPSADSEAN